MNSRKIIVVYTDYKSPYAYLAKDLVYELERDFPVTVDWLPYTLDIPSFQGSARVDDRGNLIESNRDPHQWRRVRYSYMDCRRQGRKRGLTILGPRKIWDSSVAAIGMLWAKRQDLTGFRSYHDHIFEKFWRRELDIEDPEVISTTLTACGANTSGFGNYLSGPGRAEHERICRQAEATGVFSVPTFVIDRELFWGREHLADIRALLASPSSSHSEA